MIASREHIRLDSLGAEPGPFSSADAFLDFIRRAGPRAGWEEGSDRWTISGVEIELDFSQASTAFANSSSE